MCEHKLPNLTTQLIFFEYFGEKLLEYKFPNSSISFTSETQHHLLTNNDAGIGEILAILALEFHPSFHNPSSSTDPEYLKFKLSEPLCLKRYYKLTVGDKTFFEFSEELITEVIKFKKVTLYTHPISGNYSFIYIKTFV